MVTVAGGTATRREHLVRPAPPPVDLHGMIVGLAARVHSLEQELETLRARVAVLEQPGWWQTQWTALRAMLQRLWRNDDGV